MANIELVRFLSDIAGEALANAENASPERVEAFVDEAEEILALGVSILNRSASRELKTLEVA